MYNENFEKAFDNFIDSKLYKQTANEIFSLIRDAFSTGWQAAKKPF